MIGVSTMMGIPRDVNRHLLLFGKHEESKLFELPLGS